MKYLAPWIAAGVIVLLGGCSSGPSIPDSQLSAAEVRAGGRAVVEDRWIEPLTGEQQAKLDGARRSWSGDELKEARQALDELLQERPDHPDLLANSAIVAMAQGRTRDARTSFEEALIAAPGHRVASNNLALLLRDEGDFIQARKTLLRALERHPDDPTLHYNLGVIYELYLRDFQNALNHYRRFQALSQEPDQKVAGWILDLERRVQ